jgi:hypothetical protein
MKKRLNQGEWLRRCGGFAGRAAPANVQLERRHAASENKTDIQVSIFLNSRLLFSKRLATISLDARFLPEAEMQSNTPSKPGDAMTFHISFLITILRSLFCVFSGASPIPSHRPVRFQHGSS